MRALHTFNRIGMRFAHVTLMATLLALVSASALAGPIFSDDFQTGIDPARWTLHNPGGGTWVPASEGGNGYANSPPQSYWNWDDRMDNMVSVRDDFSDFDITWDMRFHSESWHADGRILYFRCDDNFEPYGYWFSIYVTHPTVGYRHLMVLSQMTPSGWAPTSVMVDHPWSQNVWYTIRLRAAGNTFKARAWPKGSPEPATWDLEATDPDPHPTVGRIGFGDYWYSDTDVDNVVVTTPSIIAPQAPAACITPSTPCVEVPVAINRLESAPIRGYSVNLQVSPELAACAPGIVEGSYLSGVGNTHFEVQDLGGGAYTVDCAILGLPCGATAPSGTLFTLNLGSALASATGTVTVTDVTLRDCDNAPLDAVPGPLATVTIDNTLPDAIVLAAAQRRTGNDADGTTKIDVSWTGTVTPGDSVLVYRAPWGTYPEYDDMAGGVPATPAYPPGAPWTRAATVVGATSVADEPATRNFWYYAAFVKDPCGSVGPVSNVTGGTLGYHLGDVANGVTPCTGDNHVTFLDVSSLGAHYGTTLVLGDPLACIDVGPTTDYSVTARPLTDDRLNFEDLMVMALNFGQVSAPMSARRVIADRDALETEGPALVSAGETFDVGLRLRGAGDVQGISATLGWNADVAEPVSVQPGAFADEQGAVVFSAGPGNVDAAVLGTGRTFAGEGVLATVTFRAKAAGAPNVVVAKATARDASNQQRSLAGAPAVTAINLPLAAQPNPLRGATTLAWSLAGAGRVELAIYSVDGRRVTTLVRGEQPAGERHVEWNGRDAGGNAVRPGVYYARLTTPAGRQVRTLVVLD